MTPRHLKKFRLSSWKIDKGGGVEIESENEEEVQVVWEGDEPNGKILNPTCDTILDNLDVQSFGNNAFDTCVDDSHMVCDDSLDERNKAYFFFWEDYSIEVCDDDLINTCEGCEEDSLLFDDDYVCFNFQEDESFDLCNNGLISERDDLSFYSCEDEGDASILLECGDEEKGIEKVAMKNGRFVTFNNFEKEEWKESAMLESKRGSEGMWYQTWC